jgi:hypothetical protein
MLAATLLTLPKGCSAQYKFEMMKKNNSISDSDVDYQREVSPFAKSDGVEMVVTTKKVWPSDGTLHTRHGNTSILQCR